MEATNGRIRIPDKQQLVKVLDDKKLNTNNIKAPKNLKEAKSLMIADQYPEKKELPKFEKLAEKLNKKYKLKNKGIVFSANTSAKTGRVYLQLRFSSPAVREEFNKVPRITAPPTKEGIEKLTNELNDVINTDFFKNYDSREGMKSGMTTEQALKKVKYNQAELFEYLLNKEGPISEKEVMDKIGYNKGTLRKAVGNLHENIYRALDANQPGSGRFLSDQYDSDQIKSVLDKVKNNFNVDYYRRTFEKLLIDAYGDDVKKYKPLINKLEKFRDLQKELQKAGVGEEFIAQLDHVIPYNFLQLIRKGSNPEDLIRVRAYPGVLNNNLFKGTLDRKLNKGREIFEKTGDRKLLDTMNELRSFLPEDMGQVSSTGKKVIDYGAKPFNLKTLYSEQQKKFGEVYDRTQKFLENPRVIELLKDAGITFRGIGQLRRLNVPGFLNTFDKILKRRPDLRVELGDEYSDIQNQYASASMMSDVSPAQTKEQNPSFIEEYPYLVGTTAAASPLLTKTGRKIYGGVLKGGLKAFGSVPSGLGFSASQFVDINPFSDEFGELQEDPNIGLAGVDLLLPELGKRVAGSGTGILAKAGRFALNPFQALEGLGRFGRAGRIAAMGARIPTLMTPVGLGLMGIEGVMMGMREQEIINQMRETDPEAYQEYLADQEDMLRESAAYGGRMGFAEGPKDPSKRKFMKIMGGLASLPIVGKFFRVAEQTPVVQNIFTEIQKLKNSQTIMPNWFPTFLDKFRREGTAENIFKKKKVEISKAEYDKAFAEGRGEYHFQDVARTQEYKANNPDHMDYYKLEDTDQLIGTTYTNEKVPGVKVDDFDGEVAVTWENDYSQPVAIQYVKPGMEGPDLGRLDKFEAGYADKQLKPEGEFAAVDQEVFATDPDGGFDTNAVVVESLDDMMEGTTRVMEEYATGKPVRTLSRGEGKVIEAEVRAESAAEMADDFDDFE
jgi:predicted transcriptional regulator